MDQPTRRRYHTRGEPPLSPMPDPEPIDLGPDSGSPGLVDEGPILNRTPTQPPRERPQLLRERDPDEPPLF